MHREKVLKYKILGGKERGERGRDIPHDPYNLR